jgi:hypothetical protein
MSFWKDIVSVYLKDFGYDSDLTQEDLALLKQTFEKAKGSWKGLAEGSTGDVSILKRLCKAFIKRREKKD